MSGTGSELSRPKLAILGADGFIGSHVTHIAVESGCAVIAFCVKEPWRLRGIARPFGVVAVPSGAWWTAEFTDALADSLTGLDALLFHCYSPSPDREIEAWRRHERDVNVAGATRIIGLATEMGVRVVFTSSADVYGSAPGDDVGEQAVLKPATPYAEAKREVEEAILNLAPGEEACALRLSTVYGPGENGPRAIPSFIRAYLSGGSPQIHGSGTDVRDYVHVKDVATAHLRAALLDSEFLRTSGPVLNIGSGVGRSTREVLDTVAAAMGVEPTVEYVRSPRKPSHLTLDPSRATRALGIDFTRDFPAEIREEADWLRRHLAESPAA